jgi:hypothetical protein
VLDGVGALVDESLVRRQGQAESEPRFTMLETIREYGSEQLLASVETIALARRHALFYLD